MLLGARDEQSDAILAARRQGIFTVVVDEAHDAPGNQFADVAVQSDLRDIGQLVQIGRQLEIDGVMAHAIELPPIVARVAAELDLPGISPDVADVATNKMLRSDLLRRSGVRCPRQESAERSFGDLVDALGSPFVVKPLDSAGARGVSRVSTERELAEALTLIEKISHDRRSVAEELLVGREFSTEHVVYDGQIYTTGFADRNYSRKFSFGTAMIEDGHSVPSQCSPDIRSSVIRECERAIRALGINSGAAKGDVILTSSGPAILEMAARTSGGRFCSDVVPLASGVNILDFLVRVAVGLAGDTSTLAPSWSRAAAQRFFFPPAGRIRALEGLQDVRSLPGFAFLSMSSELRVGGAVRTPTSHADRVGYVIFEAEEVREASRRAEGAVASVLIDVEQEWD